MTALNCLVSHVRLVVVLAFVLHSHGINAEPIDIPGQVTTLQGSTEGIISHRFQKHSWVTPDGRFHAMINTGSASNALQLSSSDDGLNWTLPAQIGDTDRSSHGDGTLVGNRLFVAYPTVGKQIVLMIYDYNPTAKSWSLTQRVPVPGERRTGYERPSVAQDGTGRIWISATRVQGPQKKVKSIALFVMEAGGTPRLVFRDFGLNNRFHQRSARLLQIPGGLMMVFSDDPARDGGEYTLNFTQRLDSQATDAVWSQPKQILHYRNEPDDNGAHFSCAVDSLGAVHIVTRSFQTMYYLKIENGALVVGTPRDLGVSGPQQYPQACVSGADTVHLFCPAENGGREEVHVFSSDDGGASFANDYDLVFRPSERIGDRRVEAPANFDTVLPVLMLYESSTREKRLAGFLFTER